MDYGDKGKLLYALQNIIGNGTIVRLRASHTFVTVVFISQTS